MRKVTVVESLVLLEVKSTVEEKRWMVTIIYIDLFGGGILATIAVKTSLSKSTTSFHPVNHTTSCLWLVQLQC